MLNDRQMLVEEEETFDLSPVPGEVALEPLPSWTEVDWTPWEGLVKRVSAVFAGGDVALDPAAPCTSSARRAGS